ncbi:MAG: hypothetical protein AAF355_05570 [Myxococcota bacterium]
MSESEQKKQPLPAAVRVVGLAVLCGSLTYQAIRDDPPIEMFRVNEVAVEALAGRNRRRSLLEDSPVTAARVHRSSHVASGPFSRDALKRHAEQLRHKFGIPPVRGRGADGWVDGSLGRPRPVGLMRRAPGGGWKLQIEMVAEWLREDSRDGAHRRRSLEAQLEILSLVDARLDRALVVAIACREAGPKVVSSATELAHSFNEGGLDHLGREMNDLRLPSGYKDDWRVEEQGALNHLGRPRLAAWLPKNELIAAYGAVIERRRWVFEEEVRLAFGEQTPELLSTLRLDAQRTWIQIAFGASGGTEYEPFGEQGSIGLRTVMEGLKRRVDLGEASDLNDVLTDRQLRTWLVVRRGMLSAAEAELGERIFFE